MDFDTGRRELDDLALAEEEKYQAPKGFFGRVWDWAF